MSYQAFLPFSLAPTLSNLSLATFLALDFSLSINNMPDKTPLHSFQYADGLPGVQDNCYEMGIDK